MKGPLLDTSISRGRSVGRQAAKFEPERELNRFGIGQDFVIPAHAAVTRQDIRGKVRVDLIRIGVLRSSTV